jgi:four helix bundle protein
METIVKDFRSLTVWQRSHGLTVAVYRETQGFPKNEQYGLTSQIRRAVVSIPANIAEGCGRGSDADFGRFLQMAMGSACEVEYHLFLARDLGFLLENDYVGLNGELVAIKRMLAALLKRVKS